MTPFGAILSRLGLSQAEAAAALGVSLATVNSASSGRRNLPAAAWQKLPALARQMAQSRSAELLALADEIEREIRRAA